jgi:hypothetical protein
MATRIEAENFRRIAFIVSNVTDSLLTPDPDSRVALAQAIFVFKINPLARALAKARHC